MSRWNDEQGRALLIIILVVVAIAVAAVVFLPGIRYMVQDVFSPPPLVTYGDYWHATPEARLAWAEWLQDACEADDIPVEAIAKWADRRIGEGPYGELRESTSLRRMVPIFHQEKSKIGR